MTLTLVPEGMAKRGATFTFLGANAGSECASCPVQRLCFGLTAGHSYSVTRARDVLHPCALHEGGKVRVVEVAPAAFASSLESRLLRGTAATWGPIPCRMPECTNYALCHPVGHAAGRHEIVAQEGGLDCPAGFALAKVRLKPLAG